MRIVVLMVVLVVCATACPFPPSWLGGGAPTPSPGSSPPVPSGTRFVIGPRSEATCGGIHAGTLFNSTLATLTCGFLYMGDGSGTVPISRFLGETTKEFQASCNNGFCILSATTAAAVGAHRCTDKGCQLDPRAPIYNGALSACVTHTLQSAVSGSLDAVAGAADFTLSLASQITVTGNATSPCPACAAGVCAAGALNVGAACTDVAGSNFECAASGTALPPIIFDVPLANKGQYQRPLPLGFFCPSQVNAGVFGYPTADNITAAALAAGTLDVSIPHKARMASIFCVPASGNVLIDGAVGLPGPGAVSIPLTFELDP